MKSLETPLRWLGYDQVHASESPLEYLWKIGVAPLMSGAGFFLLGAPHLLQRFLPQTTLAQQGVSWLALGLAAVVLAINAIWGRRFVASRTDSSQQSQMRSKRSNWLLLPMALVPLFLVPLVLVYAFTSYGRHPDSYMLDHNRLASPAFALMFAALSLHYAWKRKASVLLAYAIYLACLALLIWWLPLNPIERDGLLMSGTGGPLAAFGALRLRAFLRAEPRPVEG